MSAAPSAKDWLDRASLYHEAADRIDRCEPAHQARLIGPTLHLVAHGYELLLKAAVLQAKDEIKKSDHTHDLIRLWKRESSGDIRGWLPEVLTESGHYLCEQTWLEDANAPPSEKLFLEHLSALSRLTTSEQNFALRYPRDLEDQAPVPILLNDVLGRLIIRCSNDWFSY